MPSTALDASSPLAFGRCVVHPQTRQLLLDGQPARLSGRAFDLLLALVERRDRVVGKNELLSLVWPGLVVEENNLRVHVAALRRLLGPQAFATIPGRGYRFTLTAGDANPDDAHPDGAAAPTPAPAQVAPSHTPELFGRETELQALRAELRTQRLVTLVGAAGIGKTSLARLLVQQLRVAFTDGAWMAELAPITDGADVPTAVANALQMTPKLTPSIDGLAAGLAERHLLLALDNCEHVIDGVVALAEALHRAAPRVHLLATSQVPLNLSFEQRVRLEALALPASPWIGDVRSAGAVALFEARAQASDPRFVLDDSNAGAVVDICRQLDGLPLAIELAAARVSLLGVEGLRSRLGERLRLLTGGARLALPRHQTLRAALDWSHGLLSDEERAVFRRLSVFVGSFGLGAAQRVASDERIDAWTALDLLGNLVDRSLVMADTLGADAQAAGAPPAEARLEPRYRLPETVREYAAARLQASGEHAEVLRRHAILYNEQALANGLMTSDLRSASARWREVLDHDNVRAALDWAVVHDASLALRSAAALGPYWRERGHHRDGERRTIALLAHADNQSPSVARVRLRMYLCSLANERGDMPAMRPLAAAVLADALVLQDVNLIALGHVWLAHCPADGDPGDAEREFRLALDLFRTMSDSGRIAETLTNIACVCIEDGRPADALPLLHEALPLYTAIDNVWGLGFVNATLSEAACAIGDFETALRHGEQGLVHHQRLQHQHRITSSLLALGTALLRSGRIDAARVRISECLALTAAHAFTGQTMRALCLLAELQADDGHPDRGAELLGAVQTQLEHQAALGPSERREHAALCARIQSGLGASRWDAALQQGRSLSVEQAIELGLRAE